MVMVSRDAVEAFGDDGIASNIEAAVGTGGMQHVSREADVQTELERNPNYFRDPLPYFDGLRADWNAWDPPYRAAQYVAGASDFLFTPWLGYPAENEAVRAQVGEENVVEVPMNATWNNATYFHTKVEPYTDPRVRTALHLATDRELLFAVTQGLTGDRRADHPRGRRIRVDRRRAPPAARLPLRRPARGGSGRGPAAARRQRLRPGERAADDRRCLRNPALR